MMVDAKTQLNKSQVAAGLNAIRAVADAIRELREVPSGELYVRVMDVLSLEQYQSIIGLLTRAGLVANHGHLLKWLAE